MAKSSFKPLPAKKPVGKVAVRLNSGGYDLSLLKAPGKHTLVYEQSTGGIYVDGKLLSYGGSGLLNGGEFQPKLQYTQGKGPTPVGTYSIGPEGVHQFTFRDGSMPVDLAMNLTPTADTDTGGRSHLLIHQFHSADSHTIGCVSCLADVYRLIADAQATGKVPLLTVVTDKSQVAFADAQQRARINGVPIKSLPKIPSLDEIKKGVPLPKATAPVITTDENGRQHTVIDNFGVPATPAKTPKKGTAAVMPMMPSALLNRGPYADLAQAAAPALPELPKLDATGDAKTGGAVTGNADLAAAAPVKPGKAAPVMDTMDPQWRDDIMRRVNYLLFGDAKYLLKGEKPNREWRKMLQSDLARALGKGTIDENGGFTPDKALSDGIIGAKTTAVLQAFRKAYKKIGPSPEAAAPAPAM